jgi:hypothetical protein
VALSCALPVYSDISLSLLLPACWRPAKRVTASRAGFGLRDGFGVAFTPLLLRTVPLCLRLRTTTSLPAAALPLPPPRAPLFLRSPLAIQPPTCPTTACCWRGTAVVPHCALTLPLPRFCRLFRRYPTVVLYGSAAPSHCKTDVRQRVRAARLRRCGLGWFCLFSAVLLCRFLLPPARALYYLCVYLLRYAWYSISLRGRWLYMPDEHACHFLLHVWVYACYLRAVRALPAEPALFSAALFLLRHLLRIRRRYAVRDGLHACHGSVGVCWWFCYRTHSRTRLPSLLYAAPLHGLAIMVPALFTDLLRFARFCLFFCALQVLSHRLDRTCWLVAPPPLPAFSTLLTGSLLPSFGFVYLPLLHRGYLTGFCHRAGDSGWFPARLRTACHQPTLPAHHRVVCLRTFSAATATAAHFAALPCGFASCAFADERGWFGTAYWFCCLHCLPPLSACFPAILPHAGTLAAAHRATTFTLGYGSVPCHLYTCACSIFLIATCGHGWTAALRTHYYLTVLAAFKRFTWVGRVTGFTRAPAPLASRQFCATPFSGYYLLPPAMRLRLRLVLLQQHAGRVYLRCHSPPLPDLPVL